MTVRARTQVVKTINCHLETRNQFPVSCSVPVSVGIINKGIWSILQNHTNDLKQRVNNSAVRIFEISNRIE